MADQDRVLSDAELQSLFDNPKADLSLLSADEHTRLLKLTDTPKGGTETSDPSAAFTSSLLKTAKDTGAGMLRGLGRLIPTPTAMRAKAAAEQQAGVDAAQPQSYSLSNIPKNVSAQVGQAKDALTSLSDPSTGGEAIGSLAGMLALGRTADVAGAASRVRVDPGAILDFKINQPLQVLRGVRLAPKPGLPNLDRYGGSSSGYQAGEAPNTTSEATPGLSMPQATYIPIPPEFVHVYGDWGLAGPSLQEGMLVNATNRAGQMGLQKVGPMLTLPNGSQIATIGK